MNVGAMDQAQREGTVCVFVYGDDRPPKIGPIVTLRDFDEAAVVVTADGRILKNRHAGPVDEMGQAIADELAPILPARWSIFSVEVVTRTGMSANPRGTSCSVRATIGPTPHELHEIAGIGEDSSTAIVQVYNRAREARR